MSEPLPPPPSDSSSAPPPGGPDDEARPQAAGQLPGGWGATRVLAGLGALLLLTLLQVVVITAFDPDIDSLGARLALQLALALTLVGVAFFAAGEGSLADPAELGLRRSRVPPFKPAALAYLVYIVCAITIALAIQPEQEDVTEELGYGEGGFANIIVGVLIIGVAPFTEEIFFRGFMFAGLRRALPFAAAAAISGGLWGLFHYTGAGTWGVVLQLFAFGLVLSWLYERTGSIWPPIAVHALNNAIAFAILTS